MKIKDIQKNIDTLKEDTVVLKNLTQKLLYKWVALGLVSAVVFGLSMVYYFRKYQTFTTESQKLMVVFLSLAFIIISIIEVILNRKQTDIIKTFKQYKIADLVSFLGVSLLVILHVTTFYFITAEVNQQSMFPTLTDGDRLIVYQFDYEPSRNDIAVIFMDSNHYSNVDDTHYVKRVVGLPGDTIQLDSSGNLYIEGKFIQTIPNDYLVQLTQHLSNLSNNKIPEGFYFILGDNVVNSYDSRSLGFIYESDIIAKVVFRFFPNFGGLS